jgi:nucleoside-diphosphate-sugar epimerase
MNFVVLGASGLVGRSLVEYFKETGQNVLEISRKEVQSYLNLPASLSERLNQDFENSNPMCIINCFGKARSHSINEIMESNCELPKKFYELSKNSNGLWINFNSFFTLYQEKYGVAKNFYSACKRNLNIYLKENSASNNLRVYNLMLGYVVSPHENSERFFSQFYESIKQKRHFHLSEGQQYLPISTLQDIHQAVSVLMKDFTASQVTHKYEEITLKPQIIDKLSNIVLELARKYDHLNYLHFNLPYQKNEFFELEWPNKIAQITCKGLTIDEIFHDYESYYGI